MPSEIHHVEHPSPLLCGRNRRGPRENVLKRIAESFINAGKKVPAYVGGLSDARQIFPWDAPWQSREVGRANLDHVWAAATIRGDVAIESARRSA